MHHPLPPYSTGGNCHKSSSAPEAEHEEEPEGVDTVLLISPRRQQEKQELPSLQDSADFKLLICWTMTSET
ncbi:hypothetical protein ATANTOWER_005849, partial [Ataeniobius toweri]|nr:hypothetical protein [Ataeniobius toweri]